MIRFPKNSGENRTLDKAATLWKAYLLRMMDFMKDIFSPLHQATNGKPYRFLPLLLIGAWILSACTGGALAATGWPGLNANQDRAYLAFQNHVYGISLSNGTETWRFPQESDNNITFFAQPVLLGDDQVLAASFNAVLYSLDRESGAERWSFQEATGRFVGAPLVTDNFIYAPAADNHLYALNHDGQLQWTFETEGEQWAPPAKNGNRLYLPSMDHKIYAVDAETGALLWSQDLGGAIVGTPVLSEDGLLYIGTFAQEIIALRQENGSEVWRFKTIDWVWSGPALAGDTLLAGDLSGKLYAVDRLTGRERWSFVADGAITGSPLVTAEGIYVATEPGSLIALTQDGAQRWKAEVAGQLFTGAVSAGELILVAPVGTDELLLAFDETGNQRWTFPREG